MDSLHLFRPTKDGKDTEYLFKPVQDKKVQKHLAEMPQREYLCGNKNHYILTTMKDDAVVCEFCQKIYVYEECEPVTKTEEKPYSKRLNHQLLPAVTKTK